MRVAPEDLEGIRARADIVDVISQYLPVQKAGRNYKAVCPFHQDHDPSLHINTDKQIFKCFVCGTGGNAISFVSKMEHISYSEAAVRLADQLHYPLSVRPTFEKPKDPLNREHELLSTYTAYCSYMLQNAEEGTPALQELAKRKIGKEIIDQFHIGYAPESRASLAFLQAKGYRPEELERTGLAWIRDNGLSAVFHNRILIPISDAFGHPVGYTARRIGSNEADGPKYINTASTPLYDKSRLIFHYHEAKEAARKEGQVYLVEGAMDVIGLAKAGIQSGIACLGTACTDEQLNLIQELHVPVRVFYDSDGPGRKACYHFGSMALRAGIPFSVVDTSSGKDPDEIFNEYGADELKKAAERTIPFPEFLFTYLQSVYNLQNYEDKKSYAREIDAAIRKTGAPYEKEAWYARLKELTGFTFEEGGNASSFTRHAKSRNRRFENRPEERRILFQPVLEDGRRRAEKCVLWFMTQDPSFAVRFREEVGYCKAEDTRALALYINDYYRSHPGMKEGDLFEVIEEDSVRDLYTDLMADPPAASAPENTRLFEDALLKLRLCTLSEQIDSLDQQIRGLSDPLQKARLAAQKAGLVKQRLELQNRKLRS